MAFIEKYLSRAQGYDKISLSSKLSCQQKKNPQCCKTSNEVATVNPSSNFNNRVENQKSLSLKIFLTFSYFFSIFTLVKL
jgi:hypothetical protein